MLLTHRPVKHTFDITAPLNLSQGVVNIAQFSKRTSAKLEDNNGDRKWGFHRSAGSTAGPLADSDDEDEPNAPSLTHTTSTMSSQGGDIDDSISETTDEGDRVGSMWIISRGVAAGDRVVSEGTSKVRDGATVNPKADAGDKGEQ